MGMLKMGMDESNREETVGVKSPSSDENDVKAGFAAEGLPLSDGGTVGDVPVSVGSQVAIVEGVSLSDKDPLGVDVTVGENVESVWTVEETATVMEMMGVRSTEVVSRWKAVNRDMMWDIVAGSESGLTIVSSAVSGADTMEDRVEGRDTTKGCVEDRLADSEREMDAGTVSGKYTNASQVSKDGPVAADGPAASVMEKIA